MPKILIADDSIAVRKVAERLLTEAGMGVTLAANSQTIQISSDGYYAYPWSYDGFPQDPECSIDGAPIVY